MENRPLLNLAMKWGFLGGIVSIVYTLILYIIGPAYLAGGWVYMGIAFTIVFMSLGVSEKRKDQGGYISLSEALLTAFMVFFITNLVSALFSYLLMNYIDPELPAIIKEEVINNTYAMMQKFGVPEDEIDKQISKISSEDFVPTLGKTLINVLVYSIFGLLISLIVGAVMKRKAPLFEKTGDRDNA